MNELDQSVSKENEIKKTPASMAVFVVAELLSLAAIIAVGWFLIGYYTKFEFLQTGYPDWIYHAFRIRDIQQYGIASWDHIWSNGINHWRAFQYVEHVLTYFIVKWTGLSITHAMLWISAVSFILIRIIMYGVLRFVGIGWLISLFVTIASYTFSQQWIALKDYSIYVGFVFIPLYFWLWAVSLKDKEMRSIYVLTAVTGALWSVHPVVGYSASGMLALLILANNLKRDVKKLLFVSIIFLVSSAPFSVPYLFSGYSLQNPIFVTPQFLRDTVISQYFGIGLFYFILIGLSWTILFVKSTDVPRWAKLLLFYCTAYIIFIYFGQLGYYPDFVNKFQFSRAIPFIAFLLPFCFAGFLQVAFVPSRSRLLPFILLTLIAINITSAIDAGSIYSGSPVRSISDPVAEFFSDKEVPRGSVYVNNFTQASYLSKSGIRFVSSYNQHALPNPYPMRFDMLMKTDIAYTGATDHQIDLINDYATVLGVEYIFIPKLSPLVAGLTVDRESSKAIFEKVGEVSVPSDTYVVLHNRQPLVNAYVFESDQAKELLHFDALPKPTLKATSYVPWDQEIQRMAEHIRNRDFTPVELSFGWSNRLMVDGSTLSSFRDPEILINQSYDAGWHVTNVENVRIEPTNLRFMHLSFSMGARPDQINLENTWPWWHWPVQSLGVVCITLTTIVFGVSKWRRRKETGGISI